MAADRAPGNTSLRFLRTFSGVSDETDYDVLALNFPEFGSEPATPIDFSGTPSESVRPFSFIHAPPQSFNEHRKCWLPGQPIRVKFTAFERDVEHKSFNPNLYIIQISHGDFHWEIRRRYKHIKALHDELVLYRARYIIPFSKERQVVRRLMYTHRQNTQTRFPKKLEVAVKEDQIPKRMTELENYLNSILECSYYRNSPHTLKFFEVSNLSFVRNLGDKVKEGMVKKCSGGHRVKLGCCGCIKKWAPGRWTTRWLLVRNGFLAYINPDSGCVLDVMLMDTDFEAVTGYNETGMTTGLRVSNQQRYLLMNCWTERQAEEWASALKTVAQESIDYIKEKRFDSFAPVREESFARWFIDGATYFEAVAEALEKAKEEIFITDWWMSPEIFLKRPVVEGKLWQLDEVLQRKAEMGVKVFILLYKEVEMVLNIASRRCKSVLATLHPNIMVLRDPDHYKKQVFLWAHHEKIVVIDQSVAFVGGIDMCFGRWDDYEHRLSDLGSVKFDENRQRGSRTVGRDASPEQEKPVVYINGAVELDEILGQASDDETPIAAVNALVHNDASSGTDDMSKTLIPAGSPAAESLGHARSGCTVIYEENSGYDETDAGISDGDIVLSERFIKDDTNGSHNMHQDELIVDSNNALLDTHSIDTNSSNNIDRIVNNDIINALVNVSNSEFNNSSPSTERKQYKEKLNVHFVDTDKNKSLTDSGLGPIVEDETSGKGSDSVDNVVRRTSMMSRLKSHIFTRRVKSHNDVSTSFSDIGSPHKLMENTRTAEKENSGNDPQSRGNAPKSKWSIVRKHVNLKSSVSNPDGVRLNRQQSRVWDNVDRGSRFWNIVVAARQKHLPPKDESVPISLMANMMRPTNLLAHSSSRFMKNFGGRFTLKRANTEREEKYAKTLDLGPSEIYRRFSEDIIHGGARYWVGKDYNNFIHKDIVDLDKPFTDYIDRTRIPRMPWHDIASVVFGKSARDVARHFIGRWNFTKLVKAKFSEKYPMLIPKSTDNVYVPEELKGNNITYCVDSQILRSSSEWSAGIRSIDDSIHQAYIHVIEKSQHFIYIENQFFISLLEHPVVKNKIAQSLCSRIIRAHSEGKKFRVIVVMPLLPGFEGEFGTPRGIAIQTVTHWNYTSMCRGKHSIMEYLASRVSDPYEYIRFFGLRQYDSLKGSLLSEMIYVHSKLMIVDDDTVIIGSANINDRSMLGMRDSEVAIMVTDRHKFNVTWAGQPHKAGYFASSMRRTLFREHLGIEESDHAIDLTDPVGDAFYHDVWVRQASVNTRVYEEVFNSIPTDSVRTFRQLYDLKKKPTMMSIDPEMARERLKAVHGYLVEMPLHFLSDEVLTPPAGTKEALLPTSLWT